MSTKKIGSVFLSFIIPVILFTITMFLARIYPFGDHSLLIWDADGQYSAFLSWVRRILLGQDDFFYTFGKILGGSNAGLLAYYGASPLNLILILFPENRFVDAFHFLVLLKIGLCGLTSYYSLNKMHSSGMSVTIFSTAYALMGYVACYFWNVMWLDGVILLPLIAIGIKELLEKNRPFLYLFSLAFALFSQYYIGYMLCIFSVLWFIYLVAKNIISKSAHLILQACVRFAFASILAGAIAALMLLPAFFSLQMEGENWLDILFSFNRRFPLNELATKFFTGAVNYDELKNGLPNLYVGIPIIALFISYIVNHSIPRPQRILSAVLIAVFLLSFQVEFFYLLWHGMDRPNAMPARFSFLFSFIIIWLAYEACVELPKNNHKYLASRMGYSALACFAGICLLLSSELPKYLAFETLLFDVICLLISFGLIVWLISSKRRLALMILFVFEFVGLVGNCYSSIHRMGEVGDLNVPTYQSFSEERLSNIKEIKEYDQSFYRIETNAWRSENDPLAYGYAGLSYYSSDFDPVFIDNIRKLGVYGTYYRTQYGSGIGPVLESLFGIKYILFDNSASLFHTSDLYEKMWNESENVTIWRNPYALPLAFVASPTQTEIVFEDNPFENQNMLIRDLAGTTDDIFHHIDVSFSIDGEIVTGVFSQAPDLPAYLHADGSWFSFNDSVYEGRERFSGCVALPDVNTVTKNKLSAYMGMYAREGGIHVSTFDQNAFLKAFESLHQNACDVEIHSASRITVQTPSLAQNSQLVLSLPYDKGWHVKADGVRASVFKRSGLLAIPLESGVQKLELVFRPQGWYEGLAISIGSLFIILGWIIFRKKCRKESLASSI